MEFTNRGGANGLTDIATIYSNNDFIQILTSNAIVLIVILYLGFFSGGIISFLVLFWNGVITTLVFLQFIEYHSYTDTIYAFVIHGILELPVFLIASNLSFNGFHFYKGIYNEKLETKLIPKTKDFIKLLTILIIAALIESNL